MFVSPEITHLHVFFFHSWIPSANQAVASKLTTTTIATITATTTIATIPTIATMASVVIVVVVVIVAILAIVAIVSHRSDRNDHRCWCMYYVFALTQSVTGLLNS